MFRRQCYLTGGWYDRIGVDSRSYIGVDNIMWETNFPLPTSTWPNSRDYIEKSFSGVPQDERDKMLWAMRLSSIIYQTASDTPIPSIATEITVLYRRLWGRIDRPIFCAHYRPGEIVAAMQKRGVSLLEEVADEIRSLYPNLSQRG